MKFIFIYLILFSLLFSISCRKYKDGPLISFRTKKQRLCRSWIINDVYKNDHKLNLGDTIEKDSLHCLIFKGSNNIFTFFENGFYLEVSPEKYYEYVDFQSHEGQVSITFGPSRYGETWWLESDKKTLHTIYWARLSVEENIYKILRLTKDELWLSQMKNGYEIKFHLFSIKDEDFKRFNP